MPGLAWEMRRFSGGGGGRDEPSQREEEEWSGVSIEVKGRRRGKGRMGRASGRVGRRRQRDNRLLMQKQLMLEQDANAKAAGANV